MIWVALKLHWRHCNGFSDAVGRFMAGKRWFKLRTNGDKKRPISEHIMEKLRADCAVCSYLAPDEQIIHNVHRLGLP